MDRKDFKSFWIDYASYYYAYEGIYWSNSMDLFAFLHVCQNIYFFEEKEWVAETEEYGS